MPQPVDAFTPASTLLQVLPPSLLLNTPPPWLSANAPPVAHTRTSLAFFGFTRILAMCSESFRPTFMKFSPPSVDLYTPSPTETLLRIQLSPVPTHRFLWSEGSTATAPMDCAPAWSNTGLKVVPPFTDFQTPPLAAPTKTVSRSLSRTAVTAEIRPLMVAEPMLRAGRPEMAPASNLAAEGVAPC